MFANYEEAPEYANELYIKHIRKLYPNMTDEEFEEMFNNFKKEMTRQSEKPDASLRN
jgi:hypothetical protein